jgi:5-methylcytosine-specific restriction endonuclease McrA
VAVRGWRWRQVRAQVLAASTTCWLCGGPGADTVDHVVPVAKGGAPYDLRNLRPAHGRKRDGCPGNFGRGARQTMPVLRNSRVWL